VSRGRLLRLLVAALSAALVWAAQAAPSWAIGPLTTGFANDPVLFNPSVPMPNSVTDFWTGRAAAVGAGTLRVTVVWSAVAPTPRPAGFVATNPASPGYNWAPVDQAVRTFAAHGENMLFNVVWAPVWAEDGTPQQTIGNPPVPVQQGSWLPDPGQLAAFGTAAAIRYSGHYRDPLHPGHFLPRIRYWQGWNEPNLGYYLVPQWNAQGQPVSPGWYRLMENAFYGAVKRVDRSNVVIMAGTAPYGNPPNSTTPAGAPHNVTGLRMAPMLFDRTLFCVAPGGRRAAGCPGPVYLDGIDHHPYQIPPPQIGAYRAGDVGIPDVHNLVSLVAAGVRNHTVLPTAHKRIFAGEVTWDSNPPSTAPGAAPIALQACYFELALYLLNSQGVDTVLWLQLRDWVSTPGFQFSFHWGGVFYYDGTPKPSATALRFPLVAWQLKHHHVGVWGRAPEAGRLVIERQLTSGRWVVLARLKVSRHQVFQTTVRFRGPMALRARIGSDASLTWAQPKAACPGH
jgi:hypothetical protein